MNQNEIIKSAISGDKEAFRMLISILRPTIEKTVFGMLGQCPEAEDIGQETFIKLYHSLDKFRFESNLKTYVTRIAINLSLNELKKRKRRTNLFESNVNITEISNNIELGPVDFATAGRSMLVDPIRHALVFQGTAPESEFY